MVASRIPASLRTALKDEGTFGMIELLDTERKNWSEDVMTTVADHFEVRLTHELGLLRREFHESLQHGLTDVHKEIASTKAEMLRWSFLFWIGQVATLAALLSLKGGAGH